MAKNIGGAARKVELTLDEIEQLQLSAFEKGAEHAREAEQKLIRLQIASECESCAQRLRIEELEQRLARFEKPSGRQWHA